MVSLYRRSFRRYASYVALFKLKKNTLMDTPLVETQSTKRELFNDEEAVALINRLIGELRLTGRSLIPLPRAREGWSLLYFLYQNGYVTHEQLRKVVHRKLIDFGMAQKEYLLVSNNYADHCVSPDALGYAMECRWQKHAHEWVRIRFDHGETIDGYRAMAEGLLERIIRQLIDAGRLNDLTL